MNSRPLRLLFVVPYVPGPVRTRAFGFIRALHARGHSITVCALAADDTSADAVRPFCDAVHVVPHAKPRAVWNCARALPTPVPLWAAYCFSPAMLDKLRRVCASEPFDVAHIEHLRAAHFAHALPPSLPIVYDAVDCLTDLQGQLMRQPDRSLVSRFVSAEEWVKLKRYEPAVTRQFASVVCTTPQEAQSLQTLASGHISSLTPITNGVDLDGYDPHAPYPNAARVVFTGKMSYAPNASAARWLARDIWPRVRRAVPNARLTIAGSAPTPAVQLVASKENGIVVTGHVPDLRPFLDEASVAVCPLRVGVGVQNKVLEAMAAGRATVVTPRAAAGLIPVVAPEALRVADEAEAFAQAVVDLLTRPSEAEALGRAARQYVERHHTWDEAAARLENLYRQAGSVPPRPE